MRPFPLTSMLSRLNRPGPFRGHNACPLASGEVGRRFFIPNAPQVAARHQHVDMVHRVKIMEEMHGEMKGSMPRFVLKIGLAGLGIGLTCLAAPVIYCDPTAKATGPAVVPPLSQGKAAPVQPTPPPPPPRSSVNFYELTFGTVCGVCAGVFVKKGAKAVAFAMGGVFVLLQYLGSLSLVRVDWSRAATRFENLFYTKDATGATRPPNVGSLFRWVIDFLTADFQQRASFIAGFTLGLRIG
ncbi:FUN14 family-domain-containing protein [Trametes elegans]|nr:FUN14 family-domain-containing protein [Trametes elegans]